MKLNEQNYNESIKKGACVVTFSAPWCKDCVALKPILSRLLPEYEGKISFFEVDFDSAEGLKDVLNIRRIPTMIFYKNGLEVGSRLVEPDSQKIVDDALKALIS